MTKRPAPPPAGVDAARAAIPPRPAQLERPHPSRRRLMVEARAVRNGHLPAEGREPGPTKRQKFSTRHTLILYMDLAGERTTDIALKLGMHPNSVTGIKSSPLYQFHKTQLLEQLVERKFDNLLDLIRSDAVKNVEVAMSIRDNEMHEAKDRLGAVRVLQKEADRIYPRQTTKHTEERIVRVSIGTEKMARIANALREVEAIEADSIPVEDYDPTADEKPPLIVAQSIDDLRNELLHAADAATAPAD